MRMATLGDGLVAGGGETLRYVCGECGAQGMPLEFEREEDYADFRASMRGPAGDERTAREAAALSDAHADADLAAAAQRPAPGVHSHPDALDRLRVMPLAAFAVGGAMLYLATSYLLSIAAQPAPFSVLSLFWALFWALAGAAFVLIGRRGWRRASRQG
jgi:hypothetical protein